MVFNESVPAARVAAFARQLANAHGGRVGYTYQSALRGFSVEMSEAQAVALSRNPQVAYVEEDAVVEATSTQTNPSWALDRIDQRERPLDARYNYANAGTGVNAYVIDSGIRYTHQEFGGRAAFAYDYVVGGTGLDCSGHGTHVAGLIGGNTYGVAKSVKLWSVRVFDCVNGGTIARIIAGVDWVTGNHVKPAVANLSLITIVANSTLDTSVRNMIAAGVTTTVAAGNNTGDASLRSPARVTEAITVAAIDQNDNQATFSNFGSVVDLYAPGVDIISAHSTGDADIFPRSGTSSAAPFVAGMAARYLSGNPKSSPAEVSQALTSNATAGKIVNLGAGSPNLLLYRPNSR
ncbi:MAG TPA: S8 family peptidase, partial [Pyrinomonadaceae bacterium]